MASVRKQASKKTGDLRQWLGENPRTGRVYLPSARDNADSFRLDGLLVDAELFRRLRGRATTRPGAEGIADLENELELVFGRPFDRTRRGGCRWLADIPLDQEFTAMVADVAHVVATHHLQAGRPAMAVTAAETALKAGALCDSPLLDLVMAHDQLENHAAADSCVRQPLAIHDVQNEEELPPRAYEILGRRPTWLPWFLSRSVRQLARPSRSATVADRQEIMMCNIGKPGRRRIEVLPETAPAPQTQPSASPNGPWRSPARICEGRQAAGGPCLVVRAVPRASGQRAW